MKILVDCLYWQRRSKPTVRFWVEDTGSVARSRRFWVKILGVPIWGLKILGVPIEGGTFGFEDTGNFCKKPPQHLILETLWSHPPASGYLALRRQLLWYAHADEYRYKGGMLSR